MQWRHRDREAYVPRPKVEKVSSEELAKLLATATRFVSKSPVLSELVAKVSLQRGRFYVFDNHGYIMARITPLAGQIFLLEAPRGDAWSAAKRGAWQTVLNALNRDKRGTFHGLGALVGKGKADRESPQAKLRELGVPVPVLAEPRRWYAMHRTPSIIETAPERALVGFESFGMFGSFGGTCLYARVCLWQPPLQGLGQALPQRRRRDRHRRQARPQGSARPHRRHLRASRQRPRRPDT